MRKFPPFMFILLNFFYLSLNAQTYTVSGRVLDTNSLHPLQGVNVLLYPVKDTLKWTGTVTGNNGFFSLKNVKPGNYKVLASYMGYKTTSLYIEVEKANKYIGEIKMEETNVVLKEVTIEGEAIPAQQKGDTTEYNSNAFKTNKDATSEDLVKKMPGVTVESGTVKAQGEDVKKVTVDGQDVFGDDPSIALRNMPADVIDKVQIFDKMSDQSQFTGFDDGNTTRTMNLITKGGNLKGQFGKFSVGYGTDNHYLVGGNINFYNGKRRTSIIGLSNNINQQNFSTQDLLGTSGMVVFGRGGSGRRSPGGGAFTGPGGDVSRFLIGQQSGINTTNSIGLNFIDIWAKKVNVNFSYFFNNSQNTNSTVLDRQYFLTDSTSQFYSENNNSKSNNSNHRFSLRLQYDIDSVNSIILTPRFNLQDYHSESSLTGNTISNENQALNSTVNNYNSFINGYSFSNSLLYRHKFRKDGRTFSINIGTDLNGKNGHTDLYYRTDYYQSTDSLDIKDQRANTGSGSFSLSTNISYTEPLSKKSILQFTYNPNYSRNNSDKETDQYDSVSQSYSIPDTSLSNQFRNETTTQRGGINYRLKGDKYNFSVGLNYQHVLLNSHQDFPEIIHVAKPFSNLLPSANLTYKFSKSANLRLFYRTYTNTPGISKLQNVIDNSNPLFLSTGNPDLKQEMTHSVSGRFSNTNTQKSRMFFALLSASITNNYIGNSTFVAVKDSQLKEGIILYKGAQLTQPVNLDGNWSIRSFFTYGFPFKFFKSNINMNFGYNYSNSPTMINDSKSLSKTSNIFGGMVISSNISEKLDFMVTYTANYNIAVNSLQPSLNNNYFYHVTTARINWLPWKWLVINSDFTNSLYNGLGSEYDQSIFFWNAGIGYKFLKNNAAELRLTGYDLLNNNKSITRTVTEYYIENNTTQVMKRYVLLTFTYNLRHFKFQRTTE